MIVTKLSPLIKLYNIQTDNFHDSNKVISLDKPRTVFMINSSLNQFTPTDLYGMFLPTLGSNHYRYSGIKGLMECVLFLYMGCAFVCKCVVEKI